MEHTTKQSTDNAKSAVHTDPNNYIKRLAKWRAFLQVDVDIDPYILYIVGDGFPVPREAKRLTYIQNNVVIQ